MWDNILSEIVVNLQKVGIGLGIFILMYISNMGASIYYNIKILGDKFSSQKLIDSGIKVASLVVAIIAFCLSVTLVIPWVNYVGLPIPEEFSDVLNMVAMCGVALTGIVKYGKEAFTKISKILN
jgi:hypothetical protein